MLCLQVDDQVLLTAVHALGGCSDARVVWDLTTGRCGVPPLIAIGSSCYLRSALDARQRSQIEVSARSS